MYFYFDVLGVVDIVCVCCCEWLLLVVRSFFVNRMMGVVLKKMFVRVGDEWR